jgi:hypothetical protein
MTSSMRPSVHSEFKFWRGVAGFETWTSQSCCHFCIFFKIGRTGASSVQGRDGSVTYIGTRTTLRYSTCIALHCIACVHYDTCIALHCITARAMHIALLLTEHVNLISTACLLLGVCHRSRV